MLWVSSSATMRGVWQRWWICAGGFALVDFSSSHGNSSYWRPATPAVRVDSPAAPSAPAVAVVCEEQSEETATATEAAVLALEEPVDSSGVKRWSLFRCVGRGGQSRARAGGYCFAPSGPVSGSDGSRGADGSTDGFGPSPGSGNSGIRSSDGSAFGQSPVGSSSGSRSDDGSGGFGQSCEGGASNRHRPRQQCERG